MGAVDEVGEVIVPAVGVIVGDDDGGAGPVETTSMALIVVDEKGLLVEWIGVAGMAVLDSRGPSGC